MVEHELMTLFLHRLLLYTYYWWGAFQHF